VITDSLCPIRQSHRGCISSKADAIGLFKNFFFVVQAMDYAHLAHTNRTLYYQCIGHYFGGSKVMGFFTKFGDGACDLAPLSGLVKNQVRAIARSFGAPESLVEKVPTADLEDLEPRQA
jgi:NAD+ synthetase